jgi:uncharacterized membrane protein (DUF373 family)
VIKPFEALLLIGIILVLCITLLGAFVDIAYVIYNKLITPPVFIIDNDGLMDLFSLILLLLIGLELIETIQAYLKDHEVHVELIVLVAIIAIARKVVVWDFNKYDHYQLYSLAAMILALGLTYFLVKKVALKIHLRPRGLPDDDAT